MSATHQVVESTTQGIASQGAALAATPLVADLHKPEGVAEHTRGLRWLLVPVGIFLGTRLLLLLIAYLGEVIFPGQTGAQNWHSFPGNLWLDIWMRFDGGWYSGITKGYNELAQAAFFPLYPLLMKLATPFFGDNRIAGIAVSNLALLGACCYLYLLAWHENGEAASGTRAVLYLTLFPTAWFLSAVYAESLFLLMTVAAVYHARRREFGVAVFFGVLASATRLVGVLIYGVVLLEWMLAQGWTIQGIFKRESWQALGRGVRSDWLTLLAIQLIPLGLISYMLFLDRTFGDYLAFFGAHRFWGRPMNPNILSVLVETWNAMIVEAPARGFLEWSRWVNLAATALALATVVPIWRRYGPSLALYVLITMLIALSSSTMSISRITLCLFPIFLLLAEWGKRRAVDQAIIAIFATFLGLLTAATVNWFFVA